MRELDLNDLPKSSIWPSRLLNIQEFGTVKRDHQKIVSEYSLDKWQKCDHLFEESGKTLSAHDLRMSYHEFTSGDERPCLLNGKLYLARIAEIMPLYDDLIVRAVTASLERTGTLVELGCGPGFITEMLSRRFQTAKFRGGDFADSAVMLAGKLYRSNNRIDVRKFDFYAERYDLLDDLPGQVTVFTCQAIEQIPDAGGIWTALAKHRSKIDRVIHLEPGYDLYDDSLLGLMRKRYIQINDYNRNLVSSLRKRSDVDIHVCEANVIGWNPFNALAHVEWSFKQ